MRRIRLEKKNGEYTKWYPYNEERFKRIFDSYNCEFKFFESTFTLSKDEHDFVFGYISYTQDR